jgi:hypothetical protein
LIAELPIVEAMDRALVLDEGFDGAIIVSNQLRNEPPGGTGDPGAVEAALRSGDGAEPRAVGRTDGLFAESVSVQKQD